MGNDADMMCLGDKPMELPDFVIRHMQKESRVVLLRRLSKTFLGRIAIWYAGAAWLDRVLLGVAIALGHIVVVVQCAIWVLDMVKP